ncbi:MULTISPECIES: hypothetical protein [unclassified Curtobacterium]|uniref:hypothetical protein n=1 Tax=unclassified Curtobacterium TaxID=257496 RepID=UPI0039AF31CB
MRDALFPFLSAAVLVLTAAGIVWRARNKRWVRDAQLGLNAQPRLSLILPVFLVLFAVVTVILGIGSLEAGFGYGWGYFPLALDALLIVGFIVWISRRPVPVD